MLLKTIVFLDVADYATGVIKGIYSKTLSSETGFNGCGYMAGKTYTLQAEMKVRIGAGNYRAKAYKELTVGGKKAEADKDGALNKGTGVICQEVRKVESDTWIAAIYKGKVYLK